jgi:hypothetical protein
MTASDSHPDLAAIAQEAEIELNAAVLASARLPEPGGALAVSLGELGYYEAELTSLRNAAATLAEAEKQERGKEMP